jgi:glycosyltransferase involved in cell wall biosynthesis
MNVSVVIPVYNAEKFIGKAIESCLQLPAVKEIVVVDDGYRDNAKAIVRDLADKHPIIKLYEHPNNENRGAGPSRNLGIEKATQDFIAFLDADDFFHSYRFEKDIQIFNDYPDADGCYNAIDCYFYSDTAKERFVKKFHSTVTTVNPDSGATPENLFSGLIGAIPNYGYFSLDGLTVKREFLKRTHIMFPSLSVHQDTVFIIKLAHYGKLYPSELRVPVTLRGVHEENRITANYELEKVEQFQKRYLMWNYLYEWAKGENIKKQELNLLKKQTDLFKTLSAPNPKLSELLKLTAGNVKVLLNPDFRSLIIGLFR